MFDLSKMTTAEYYQKRHNYILNKLDSLIYGERLHAIKPFDILCSQLFCPAVKEGKSLYFDDDHLSLSGAVLVTDALLKRAN